MSEPVAATATSGEDECRRFLDDLGNSGPVGELLIEHMQGLSFLFEHTGSYDTMGEIASMRRMFIYACEARQSLPSVLPKVSAVVNLSNKRFVLLSNEWNLAVALALAPSGTQPRIGRNINGVVKAAQRDGHQLLVLVYAPFQGGASALGWELRTIRRHASPTAPGGFVYRDDGLCISNVDAEPRLAGSSIDSVCAPGLQREAMLRCMTENFPVVDLDAALNTASLPPGPENADLGNAGMALLRRLQSERKTMMVELQQLKSSAKLRDEERTAEVDSQLRRVEQDREQCKEQLESIKAKMRGVEEESAMAVRSAEASVAAAELQRDEESAKRAEAERALRQSVALNAQRDATVALERGKLHVETKRSEEREGKLRREAAALRDKVTTLESKCNSLSASKVADILNATNEVERLQADLEQAEQQVALDAASACALRERAALALTKARARAEIKSALVKRYYALKERRTQSTAHATPPTLFHAARPATDLRRLPNGSVYDRRLEEDVTSLHAILARMLSHARAGALAEPPADS